LNTPGAEAYAARMRERFKLAYEHAVRSVGCFFGAVGLTALLFFLLLPMPLPILTALVITFEWPAWVFGIGFGYILGALIATPLLAIPLSLPYFFGWLSLDSTEPDHRAMGAGTSWSPPNAGGFDANMNGPYAAEPPSPSVHWW
jgi:hypothetical protein